MTVFDRNSIVSIDTLKGMFEGRIPSGTELAERFALTEYTYSAITCRMSCGQKYWLRYVLGLVPTQFQPQFFVGQLMHKFYEISLPYALGETKDVADMFSRANVMFHKEAQKVMEGEMLDPFAAEKLAYCLAQVKAMSRAWITVQGPILENYTLVSTEEVIRAEKEDTGRVIDKGAGAIDGILVDPQGDLWILEHKNYSMIHHLSTMELVTNFQANWYIALVIYRLLDSLKVRGIDLDGRRLRGFVYNVVKKPSHRLNAKKDYKELEDRMYAAMVDKPDSFFFCEPVEVNHGTVSQAISDAEKVIAQLRSLNPSDLYRNTTACENFAGCEYKPLCQNGAYASDLESILCNPMLPCFRGESEHCELTREGEE